MNEGDSAGGHLGRSPAPPAVIDRRSNISGISQMSSGSAAPMSRLSIDRNSQQQQQQHQQIQLNTRIPFNQQLTHQISGNNNLNNSNSINSNSGGVNLSSIKTESVVSSGVPSDNLTNLTFISSSLTSSTSYNNQSDSNSQELSSPTKKKVKSENNDDAITALQKRILEHKYQRLKSVKERYIEHVSELFFLQTGGSMMDYPGWRRKPHTLQYVNFMKSYKLDQTFFEESTSQANAQQTAVNIVSHGTEIKIPGVGVTPVAVSTQLPAAVAQLSQQGGTPLLLEPSNTVNPNLENKDSIINPPNLNGSSSVGGGGATPSGNGAGGFSGGPGLGNSGQEQFSAKARQEVYVMQRVNELQREGLWTERRLPKVQEPARPKAHWDYLLEEMVWLAADFAQERKWKKAAAKKCARMVQKYFQDKALAAQKAEKAQEMHLKRIASFVSKEIKIFWSNVEKLVEYKQHTKLEEKRKKALDQHLSFIVDQTEKFSQQLAEGMNKSVDVSRAPSLNSSRISSPKPPNASDDEFSPGNASSDDDEETIAKAEAEQSGVNEEVAALQRESEMDLDDFLKELPKDYLENRDKITLSDAEAEEGAKSDEDDDEFKAASGESSDDENTINEQEEKEGGQDHKKELDELNADNEMSIEDLMAKYKNAPPTDEKMDVDSDDGEDEVEENSVDESDGESDMEMDSSTSLSDEDVEEEEGDDTDSDLKNLFDESGKDNVTGKENDIINDAAAIAESLQPKGNTLSSTNVVTPVPFLLKHSLREYQHIGLDWLVTMHDRKLNGILADEMGLGKTIQTIALLGHLACEKGNWGPHLIIVPSSVMLNWEMEFKKWCPGFKILTYYGTQKERKMKRIGWTKPNAFHVCITSYKLVIQDHQSFRRKKWKYLILDEAQNIKNFKSQRWQLLLNFATDQRLLLTGTPLQNNLMELWSLMHFLMPHVFQSHREFKEWFSNPMTGMIEGNSEYNESIIKRLHKVLRPFLLRRLKSEVEKQMPKKYEHVVMCRLSKRQRFLYDDFMSRAKTRETLASGNLLSVINVLMQLRKVCNHPNLFEVRPTISPFQMEGVSFETASLVTNMLDYNPFTHIDLSALNLVLLQLEMCMTAYVAHRVKKLITPKKLIEEIDSLPEPPPQCPSGKLRLHVRVRDTRVQETLLNHNSGVRIGTSPAMKTEGTKFVPITNSVLNQKSSSISSNGGANSRLHQQPTMQIKEEIPMVTGTSTSQMNVQIISSTQPPPLTVTTTNQQQLNLRKRNEITGTIGGQRVNVSTAGHVAQIVQTTSGRHILLTPTTSGTSVMTTGGQRLTVLKNVPTTRSTIGGKPLMKIVSSAQSGTTPSTISQPLAAAIVQQWKTTNTNGTSQNLDTITDEESKVESEFTIAEREEMRKQRRAYKLSTISNINCRRCDATPIYGQDLRDCTSRVLSSCKNDGDNISWQSRSFMNCQEAMLQCNYNTTLSSMIKSYAERTQELKTVFDNFIVFVPPVSAPMIRMHVTHQHPSKQNEKRIYESVMQKELSPKMTLLHPIISAMCTQFPDPRLIQYDCGKLQTLDKLLRKLRTGGHRVLIFTQMTRMLDVLEAFLNYHGHIYLRLDGTTKIENRQIYMERFNEDKRIFAFILSTRSGGVGINLTGADTVIFYDSDWNPTMDAQAQDRCHRIGQTRDVHIYRLISEKTIEENILKKANQKRLLGDMAIEGGNFTTAYFKSSTIQDIFDVDTAEDNANARLSEVVDQHNERRTRSSVQIDGDTIATGSGTTTSAAAAMVGEERSTINAFESALAAAEDEQDVVAATTAKAEAAADLDEFDENIPLEEIDAKAVPEMSKAEQEVQNLIKQLSPIERYAMRFVEETGGSWTAEQLRQAEAEIEQQKREWEANRLAAIKKEEEEMRLKEEEDNEMLTYSAEDARNQVWISNNTMEIMPMWCPPTPPQDDNDVYHDYALSFLYDTTEVIPEMQLPPVYVKKEFKRSRSEAGFFVDGRRPIKIRKEDSYYPPRSLFEKPSQTLAKIRRELKLQRFRGNFKSSAHLPGIKLQQVPTKTLNEPEGMSEWYIYEDMSILNVIQNLQGLPLNLMLLSPGHTPNWDLVADITNQTSRTFRPPKHCRYRYESAIVPREEGILMESTKKEKKKKNPLKMSPSMKGVRSMKTAQCYLSDNNASFTKLVKAKIDLIKTAYLNKAPQLKQVLVNPSMRNPKHVAVLSDYGIANYETPITPIDLAVRRAERLNKDKQKSPANISALPGVSENQSPSPQPQQIQIQTHVQQQQQTAVAQQQQPIVVQTSVQGGTPLLVQSTPIQVARSSTITPQQQQQLVKALVASSGGSIQQITVSQANQSQLQQLAAVHQQQAQLQQQQSTSVSVVLTTPVSSLSTIQHTSQPQMVSIHTPNIVSSNAITSQSGTLVQSTQSSLPHVVSVSQLATVGTVITTAALASNVATLSSSLRAQRIVAPSGIQEVILNPRSGSQSPTVVSVSGLGGQQLTPAQLQATQLRLMGTGQQMSGVVTKSIPVGSVQSSLGKQTNTPQIQFYRQQTLQRQFKVLHPNQTGGTAAVVQTAGGQATLVAPGTIIQSGIVQQGGNLQTVQVQQAGGQKVQLVSGANVSGTNTVVGQGVVGTVATVQMAPVQGRPQFVKHIQGNKQTITRQVSEGDMQALMKRQILNQQQQKAHVISSQPQIQFAQANVQVQQPGTSGQQQQQIATLVKTGSGLTTTTLQQVKAGQIKTVATNQTQVRQLQLQQQIAMAQQRKTGKVTQFAQVTGKGGIPTQLIVQNPKSLPGTVTVQQIQQVIRHAQPGTLSAGQIVLGKPGRVIPVSVSNQPNARQTIQVVAATSQAMAGNLRTHVPGQQNITGTLQGGTIKVTGTQAQQQQALLNALQNQHQRQNQSPVRLQTTSGGSLVAVTVQQSPQVSVSVAQSSNTSSDSSQQQQSNLQQGGQQQTVQQNQQQQANQNQPTQK